MTPNAPTQEVTLDELARRPLPTITHTYYVVSLEIGPDRQPIDVPLDLPGEPDRAAAETEAVAAISAVVSEPGLVRVVNIEVGDVETA